MSERVRIERTYRHAPAGWGEDQTVTAEFLAAPDGCRLVVTHEGVLGEGMSPILNEGWSASVEQLATMLRSRA